MLKIATQITLLAILTYPGIIEARQQPLIDDIRVSDFDRFRRVEIFTSSMPEYTITDSSEAGALYLQFAGAAASTLKPIRDARGEVISARNVAGTMVKIALPFRFRYDAFYFSPAKKLIIDCYPNGELAVATRKSTMEKAAFALQSGDTLQALTLLEKEASSNPDNTRVYLQMGMLYFLRNDTERARQTLEKIRRDQELGLVADGLLRTMFQPAQHRSADGDEQPAGQLEQDEITAASAPAADTLTAVAGVHGKAEKENKATPEPKIISVRKAKSWLAIIEEFLPAPVLMGILAVPVVFFAVLMLVLYRRRRLRQVIAPRKTQYNRIMNLMQANATYQQTKTEKPAGRERHGPVKPQKDELDRLEENLMKKQHRRPYVRDTSPVGPAEAAFEKKQRQRPQFRQVMEQYLEDKQPAATQPAPDRSSQKARIRALAAEGMTVRQIAEHLNMGVGEVELVLEFSRLDDMEAAAGGADPRMDFSF